MTLQYDIVTNNFVRLEISIRHSIVKAVAFMKHRIDIDIKDTPMMMVKREIGDKLQIPIETENWTGE